MPKGKKKAKWKPQNPKLSFLNQVLYWVLMIFGMILVFSPVIVFTVCQQQLGKANNAIAVEGTASVLWLLLPLFPAIVGGLVFWEIGYTGRIPLIPSRENPPVKRKKKQSPAQKWVIVLAICIWLTTFVPAFGAVYNRIEINTTHIDTYAMFGPLAEHRPIGEAASVCARIYYDIGRGAGGWRMSYTIYFADGEAFHFAKVPSIMLKIDALFLNVPKTVEGAENYAKLCDEYDCTEEEREGLKRLFLIEG